MAHAARQAARSRLFTTTERTRQTAVRYASGATAKLQRMGLPRDAIDTYVDQIISGLANQLLNIPVDMFIEHTLYHGMPFLRPSQLVSLHATHQEALKALMDPSVKEMAPTRVYQANVAMNCAFALFTDSLFDGATAYADPYRGTSSFARGRRLIRAWEKALADFTAGDEYDLVDTFADILKLRGWYEWAEDRPQSSTSEETEGTGPQGNTNPELLRVKQPAAVMYFLSALRRFGSEEEDRLRQIVTEIAVLGQSGLDYASSEKQYTLRSLPGERFSGLELMCLIHVGLKRIDPRVDPGTSSSSES